MILNLTDINISFGKNHFLGPINASFENGCLNLIVGRSGSGKSTLLKLLAGFHKEFTGSITLDYDKFIPDGNISLTFQNPETIFFNSTVFDVVSYSLKISNLKENEIKEKTNKWLKTWGLSSALYSEKYPFNLSGGEKRRVALAACTILEPKVILLDEPVAGLDRVGQKDLSEIINSLAKEHIVIIVTHEPELLINNNSHILFIDGVYTKEFNVNDFLSKAIQNSDFYPLPEWYVENLKYYVNSQKLPIVKAEEVANFLENQKNK